MSREYHYSEDTDVSEFFLNPTDLKQFVFCPRVTYFTRVMRLKPVMGSQQESGKKSHETLSHLEERRHGSLKTELPFSVTSKELDVKLSSERLGVQGRLDMLLHTGDGEYIPVEFKEMSSHRGEVHLDHKYQLLLLALLIEDASGKIVRRGVVYYIPEEKAVIVPLTEGLKRRTIGLLRRITEMIATGQLPLPREQCRRNKVGCGFSDACRDL